VYFYAGTGPREKREERETGTNLDCVQVLSVLQSRYMGAERKGK